MIGQALSHYRVLEKLGGGGMGVVYRAEDERLRRHVAIKLLPQELTRDADAKRRFVLEAQAASALDHPNICTIHEIDETPDGQLFLVMAYYDGETLKTKIERGPLKLDAALDYAVQMAQGLVKAHGAGIVHRDIKPANTLVTSDGLVKILDFGLARLLGQTGVTRTGTTLGTPAYMSPEQMLGSEVDARSDLWSMGVVLYEMLSGQLPFGGEHPATIAHAITHATPAPLTSLRSGIPIELERIVGRMLAKSPADRYQTAADLLSELRRVQRESDSRQVTIVAAPQSPNVRGKRTRAYWAMGMTATVAVLAYGAVRWLPREPSIPTLANPVQVAATVAIEDRPAWSPDGRMIAFQSDQGGKQDIWIVQVGGGPAINRTAAFEGDCYLPRWSPDGRQFVFSSNREGGGFFVMPALAGGARKVAPSPVPASAAWSPDGSQLIYTGFEGGTGHMEILDLRTNTARRLPADAFRMDLSWSPDGRFVAFIDSRGGIYTSQITQLSIMDVRDGTVRPITDGRAEDWTPSWSPDSRILYFTSNRGGTRDLWRQRLDANGRPVGAAQPITTGLDTLQAAISPDGTRLVFAKGRHVGNVWRLSIHAERPATWTDAQQLTFDQAHIEYLDLSTDGRQLAVQSDRGGNPDIWTLPAAGGEMQRVVSDPTPDWYPAWSPDGRTLAFYSYRTGRREVWIQPVAGGTARQLTFRGGGFPVWSPDGATIFISGMFAVPVAGGEPRQIAAGGTPSASPDGKWLAFSSSIDGEPRVSLVPVSGGAVQPVTRGEGPHRWSPDGRSILFRRGGDIWRVAPNGEGERPLTSLTGRRGSLGHFDADDRYIYFSWREDVSDISVMDVDQKR